MPFKIRVMGIEKDRVTFGIKATFQGQDVQFHQSTFSLEAGSELNLTMMAKFYNGGVMEEGELQITPDGLYSPVVQSLYKVETN